MTWWRAAINCNEWNDQMLTRYKFEIRRSNATIENFNDYAGNSFFEPFSRGWRSCDAGRFSRGSRNRAPPSCGEPWMSTPRRKNPLNQNENYTEFTCMKYHWSQPRSTAPFCRNGGRRWWPCVLRFVRRTRWRPRASHLSELRCTHQPLPTCWRAGIQFPAIDMKRKIWNKNRAEIQMDHCATAIGINSINVSCICTRMWSLKRWLAFCSLFDSAFCTSRSECPQNNNCHWTNTRSLKCQRWIVWLHILQTMSTFLIQGFVKVIIFIPRPLQFLLL